MFDDQLTGSGTRGQVPSNLPIGEPEDMFSGALAKEEAPRLSDDPPSALEAGVLKPKVRRASAAPKLAEPLPADDFEVLEETPMARPVDVPAPRGTEPLHEAPASYPEYRIQEPSIFKSIFLVIAILILVAGLGFGGYWAYKTYIAPTLNSGKVPNENDGVIPSDTQGGGVIPEPTEDDETDPIDDAILFGNVPDTDGDGLDDLKEGDIGTDPKRFDTDGDGLSDYDEVVTWKSNPQNPDTDNDGYTDEEEIKNGYSPLGAGRIFEPPTTSPRTL